MSNTRPPPQNQPPTNQSGSSPNSQLVPSDDEVATVGTVVAANKVAPATTVTRILDAVKAVHPNATSVDLFELAWACYHNGSSRFTTLEGVTQHQVQLATLKDIVEEHCTLRQFCMFYAKICYNKGREERIPPANWATKGFAAEDKYAAFDFFTGTLNDAAAKPRTGMKHQPSASEIQAHSVNATMAIVESRAPDNQFSTRGNILGMQQVRSQPRPPLITFN